MSGVDDAILDFERGVQCIALDCSLYHKMYVILGPRS
jgi:hypothetical protein